LRNGRIGIFDLSNKESSEEVLDEANSWEGISAVRISQALLDRHGPESLIFATGALTASFVPASCCGFIRTGGASPRISPLLGFAGVELKLSGFDFVVLKGRAEKPGYLWVRDGIIEFSESDEMRSMNAWARTDRVRTDQGDSKIQVVTVGPWGDAMSPASQIVIDYWGGEDKVGMAAEFGRRGLLAVAFRGMGELEIAEPEGHFEEALLLMREQIARLGDNKGLASYFDGAAREDFGQLVHRHVGCYGCPFPCRTYVKVDEDPRELRLESREPGYLHYDIPALEAAFGLGLDARSATLLLRDCAKAGVEPVAAAKRLAVEEKLSGGYDLSMSGMHAANLLNAGAKNFERAFVKEEEYLAALGLGLCPRYWSKAGWDLMSIAPFAESAFGWQDE